MVDLSTLGNQNLPDGIEGWLRSRLHSLSVSDITADRIVSTGSLRSDGFEEGAAGWQIKGDGDAEFNGVTVRGTIVASDGEITGDLDVSGALTLAGAGASFATGTAGAYVAIDNDDILRMYTGVDNNHYRMLYDGAATSWSLDYIKQATEGGGAVLTVGLYWDAVAGELQIGPTIVGDGGSEITIDTNLFLGTGATYLVLEGAGAQIQFDSDSGPIGFTFANYEGRLYYRTTPNQVSIENNAEQNIMAWDVDDGHIYGGAVAGTERLWFSPDNTGHLVIDNANEVRVQGGDNNDPSYTFSDDQDTGMYRNAANVLGFSAGGSTGLVVTVDGAEVWNGTQMELTTSATDGRVRMPSWTGLHLDGNSPGALFVMNPGASAYRDVKASAFDVSSDRRRKRNVRPEKNAKMLDKIRRGKGKAVARFRREADEDYIREGLTPREEFGLIAQEVPEEARVDLSEAQDGSDLGVSLSAMLAVHHLALEEIEERLAAAGI